MAFFFDGTGVVGEPGPVTDRVRAFMDLMKYRGDQHKPRYLRVRWGPLDFRGVMKTASASFTLFDREGRPVRAKVNAAFEEVVADSERVQREGKSSPDLHRVWRVRDEDRLDVIAFEAYGDAAFWRPLAEANGLENPRALVPGQLLRLPPKER
jgi:nucleoid-associated protein YgaU